MDQNGLHERLKTAAGERTYRQLGDLTGTNAESVRRYMQGQAPSVEFLARLCGALGVNGDWLLIGQGPMLQSEIRDHALRDAGTPDLLRATSDTVSHLIDRVDRLERFVQTAETRLRTSTNGDRDDGPTRIELKQQAKRIGAAVAKRPPQDAD